MKTNQLVRCTIRYSIALPYFSYQVPAGFPSPADDYVEQDLDLNQFLVEHPSSTYFVRVQGHSMAGAGIQDQDLLVIDRSITPEHGSIVVALVSGELTVKRLCYEQEEIWLRPEHPDYPPIHIKKDDDFQIWGVVTSVVRRFTKSGY
uniref:Translesion error-prone DNA polymerase V autoproteolytic subunit n=1 Tax=Roseihalotalea indica TaxID=2867963 RepID=A0AA49JK97_9BACT|nr:translesion error-prone DNA polymerase V autoproteolytic subunit [Tunicatimonas sp. TK19036]